MSELALRLIAENKAAHERCEDATVLDLGNCGLTELPEELFECTWLEDLTLSNSIYDYEKEKWTMSKNKGAPNMINLLPKSFFELNNLKKLHIGGDFRGRWGLNDISSLQNLITLKSLVLSNNQLKDVSPLKVLTSLKFLDLSNNQLDGTSLESLVEIHNLQNLYLSSNELIDIKALSNIVTLKYLNLSSNQLIDISPISSMINLKYLDLSFNYINGITYLGSITTLQYLNLSFNYIKDIRPLAEMTNLQVLMLKSNLLSDISPLVSLNRLDTLNLARNHLTDVSTLSSITNLQALHLNSNYISNITPLTELTALQCLNLSDNRINLIPLNFLNKINLELNIHDEYGYGIGNIYLKNNQIGSLPSEVVKSGRAIAIEYLKEKEKQPLNECKVIIIGRGGVGKTSLQKRLTNQPFDPKESQTHGIRKVKWCDGVKAADGEFITVNFWDFGGQDIQQALHQFFYSKNTIYILVLDQRQDEEPESFLDLVNIYGHASPVLVVLNNKVNLENITAITYDLHPGLDSSIRSKYPMIRKIFGVCCAQENDIGIQLIKKFLSEYIPALDHVRERYPSSWLRIKYELLDKVQKNYIRFDEYQALCRLHQVEMPEVQKGLAEMLDTVGTITFFDKQFLGNYYILNPDWITTGTYQIIESKHTNQQRGRISWEDLKVIFSQPLPFDYKIDEFEFLLNLMQEFNLCHAYNKSKWLIPSSLDGISKTDLVTYRKEEHRLYCIQYKVSLHSSVIHRFIARNIKYAYQNDYWRNGIVVKHPDSETTIFVEADKRERQIRLFAKGERIRDCWEFFRKDLKEFSGEFDYDELVVINNGDTVSYQYLMEALLVGEQEVFISKKTGRINVQETLGLFEKRDVEIALMHSREQVNKLNHSRHSISEIFNLIDQNRLFDAFEKIDELEMEGSSLSKLQAEFEGGHQGVDYIQRLKMCIKRLSK